MRLGILFCRGADAKLWNAGSQKLFEADPTQAADLSMSSQQWAAVMMQRAHP